MQLRELVFVVFNHFLLTDATDESTDATDESTDATDESTDATDESKISSDKHKFQLTPYSDQNSERVYNTGESTDLLWEWIPSLLTYS